MIVDCSFKVFVVIRNGEKYSVQPRRSWADNLINQFDKFGDDWKIECYTIRTNRDLEDLLEDDVSDNRLERWENAANTGDLTIDLD